MAMPSTERDQADAGSTEAVRGVKLLALKGQALPEGYSLIAASKWLDNHTKVLAANCHLADVVYTRWTTPAGPFPFSPYSRSAHLSGLNFVGTDVCLSSDATMAFECRIPIEDALRRLATEGFTFHGVDAVTYERTPNGS